MSLATTIVDQAARAAARLPRETGLLFSAPMARSAHRGDKTQTRRMRGLDAVNASPDEWTFDRWQDGYPDGRVRAVFYQHGGEPIGLLCPYGQSGDVIYAKETWAVDDSLDALAPSALEFGGRRPVKVHFLADGPKPEGFGKLRVSLHMPRAAARTVARLSEVRVQRLHQISEADAKAEGALWHDGGGTGHSGYRHDIEHGYVYPTARESFARLWVGINGPVSWAASPWVWCLSFFLIQPAPRKES